MTAFSKAFEEGHTARMKPSMEQKVKESCKNVNLKFNLMAQSRH